MCLKKDHAASILEEINVGSAHMMDFPTRRRAGAQGGVGGKNFSLMGLRLIFWPGDKPLNGFRVGHKRRQQPQYPALIRVLDAL